MKIQKIFQFKLELVKLLMLQVKQVNQRELQDFKHIQVQLLLVQGKGIYIIYNYRAELANDEYIPVQDMILENFVILKKNPDYRPEIE